MNYIDFLKSKIVVAPDKGIVVQESELSPVLKPHQKDTVIWALKGGQRAIFSSFGLGKTITQLEIMRLITKHEEGKCLIITPLNIVHVFQEDAKKLLNGLEVEYIKTQEEAENSKARIVITNYERVRDGNIRSTEPTRRTHGSRARLWRGPSILGGPCEPHTRVHSPRVTSHLRAPHRPWLN